HDSRLPQIKRFMRGGYWRNFKVKYPEAQEMYARMMQISRRLQETKGRGSRIDHRGSKVDSRQPSDSGSTNPFSEKNSAFDPQSSILDPLVLARRELYRAQCNCPWWHGAFVGLYLLLLRNAAYHYLIAAENALLESESRNSSWVEAEQAGWD